MVLGVDCNRAVGHPTGVGRNVLYLLEAWATGAAPFDSVRAFSHRPLAEVTGDGALRMEVLPSRGAGIWWQATRLRSRAAKADVLLAPYTIPPAYPGRSVVLNFGIYEGPHAIPGWRARAHSRHLAYSARRADAVIAVSATAKGDLVRFYAIPPEKITIAWPGLDRRFRPRNPGEDESTAQTAERFLGARVPYFLFVGKPSLRRNVPALIEAFATLRAAGSPMRLLLVGPGTDRVVANADRLGDAVRQADFLSLDELAVLYRGATAFLMPSTREGFSATVLEAMASGCPVMTVSGASLGVLDYLSESAGGHDGALLEAADESAESLAEAMTRLADDADLRETLSGAGLRCAATFPSWEDHAAGVLDVLADVAARTP